MRTYLEAKGYELKTSSGQDVARTCPFCEDTNWHFYIDPEKMVYFCHKCNVKGNEITLRKHFNDLSNVSITSFRKAIGFKEPKKPADDKAIKYHEALLKNLPALDYLKKRGIEMDTIKHFKLGYMKDDREWISIPYFEDGQLVNFKFRSLEGKEFKKLKDAKSTLFNQDCIKEHEGIIITEGELDAIMCWQSGLKNVVSIPNGCSNFDAEWIDLLQDKEKIYLWYDNDDKGRKASDEVAQRLGVDRCYFIRPEGLKDANEYFYVNKTLDLTMATQKKIDNLILFFDSVYQIFEHEKNISSDIRMPWDNVNRLVRNIDPGDLIALSAVPKTGKTTFALNIATYNAKRGYPVLFYCLEMRPERLAKKVIQSEGKISSENFNRDAALTVAQRHIWLPLFFAYDYKNITHELVFQTIRATVRRYGIKLLVFDNLHYLVRSLTHTTQEVGLISRSFKLLAEELQIPIILIAQPRKVQEGTVMSMNDLKDSSSIGADSDQVIILWRKRTQSTINGLEQVSSYDPKTLVRVDASRYAPGGDTVLHFEGKYSLFAEVSQ